MSSCVNHIGGGAVYVAAETAPGAPIAIAGTQFLPNANAVTMPAINVETVENGAIRADRGQNLPHKGNPAELAWSLQIVMPAHPAVIAPVAALFAAAGLGDDGQPVAGAICDKTLQIARIDRDGNVVEILNGCLVSSFDISAAPNDEFYCTFNGTASYKTELLARSSDEGIGEVEAGATSGLLDNCLQNSLSVCYNNFSALYFAGGVSGVVYDEEGQAYSCSFASGGSPLKLQATISDTVPAEGMTITGVKFALPTPAAAEYDTFKGQFLDMRFGAGAMELQGVSAFNVTFNTGLSYVSLGVTDKVPTNRQSGAAEITGSFSVILNQHFEAFKAAYFANSANQKINLTGGSYSLNLTSVSMSDFPAYDLANDALATGSISFRVNNLGFKWAQNAN